MPTARVLETRMSVICIAMAIVALVARALNFRENARLVSVL